MPLLEPWKTRLANLEDTQDTTELSPLVIPRSASYYSGRLTYVSNVEAAQEMLELASQRPLGWIGFDTEFKYDRPGVVTDSKNTLYDPRSIHPLLLSLAFAEPDGQGGGRLYRFVVDLRVQAVYPLVAALLQLPAHCNSSLSEGSPTG